METTPSEIEYTYKINQLSDWEFNVEISLYSKGASSFLITMINWNIGLMFTQNYSISGYFQNGNIINENDILHSNDIYTFFVVCGNKPSDFEHVSWKMLIQKQLLIHIINAFPFLR